MLKNYNVKIIHLNYRIQKYYLEDMKILFTLVTAKHEIDDENMTEKN